MAHFAQLDENNNVINVVKVLDEVILDENGNENENGELTRRRFAPDFGEGCAKRRLPPCRGRRRSSRLDAGYGEHRKKKSASADDGGYDDQTLPREGIEEMTGERCADRARGGVHHRRL